MVRFLAFVFATLILVLPAVASGQTTATATADPASFAEPADASGTTTTVASAGGSSSGGTPASPSAGDLAMGSGGGATTPAIASDTGAPATASGDVPISGDVPLATMAQEPEPDPEGPGEEQPSDPGGEPQPPTGDDPVEVPGGEAPAGGGGLPRTGLEALKLALLGLVLLLVGARVRVIARRRWGQSKLAADGLPDGTPTVTAVPTVEPEDAGGEAETAADYGPDFVAEPEPDYGYEDVAEVEPDPEYEYVDEAEYQARPPGHEWSFPDPNEPAPTGLLPSTAMAKRRARERGEGDRPS